MHENYPNITNIMQLIGIARKENLQCAYIQELQIAERWATILRKKDDRNSVWASYYYYTSWLYYRFSINPRFCEMDSRSKRILYITDKLNTWRV